MRRVDDRTSFSQMILLLWAMTCTGYRAVTKWKWSRCLQVTHGYLSAQWLRSKFCQIFSPPVDRPTYGLAAEPQAECGIDLPAEKAETRHLQATWLCEVLLIQKEWQMCRPTGWESCATYFPNVRLSELQVSYLTILFPQHVRFQQSFMVLAHMRWIQ